MAQQVSTTVVIQAKNQTQQGISEAKSSFQEFTSSLDSLTGGLGSKITNLLANPWTAVAAGIGVAGKAFKDFTEAGMVANDRLDRLSATLGSKTDAESLIGTIATLSDMSWESRESIEAFATKLAGAGHSAQETQDILTATVDICNVTGRGFSEVGSAIENAFNGKTTTIEKILPSLKELDEDAWKSGDAIKYIGEQLHESSVQIASGSLSNQLGALGNSWERIKENLGGTIVTQIQSSGILDTISAAISNIEKYTDYLANKARAQAVLEGAGASRGDAMTAKSGVSSDYAWTTSLPYSPYNNTADRLQAANALLDTLSRGDENYTPILNYILEAQNGNIVEAENRWQAIAPLFNQELSINNTRPKTQEELYSDIFTTWNEGVYKNVDWSKITVGGLDALIEGEPDAVLRAYYESKRSLCNKSASTTTTTTTTGSAVETPSTTVSAWNKLGASEGYYWNEVTGQIEERESILSRITNNQWDQLTDSDFNKAITALSSIEEGPTRDTWISWLADKYVSYQASKNVATVTRDHSILGKSFKDFGLGYEAYQTGAGVPSVEAVFGVNGPVSLGSEGLSFGLTDYNDIKEDLDQQHQEDQAQAQKEAEERAQQIQSVITAINSVTSSISGLYNVWSNGYQAGDVGSTIGSIGSVVSLFSPLWGAGISAAGGIVGFLEQVFQGGQGEIESSLMEGTSGETAVYNGATTVHINNYFEGAYIVGAGGMTELANIMVEEIEGLQYTNR